ncbi:SusC/RagA family TonB-linked outer membrane protein [Gracilimonas sp.]|uniref:SusC/RagA family TonB-linked outer membrane protein n=1 Tax=Gracilimonas sp. TaxID=1974203 RepID=UPI003D0AC987
MKIITFRTILYMSFCTIWGFIFSFITATALMAGTTSAQSVSEVDVTVEFEQATIQQVFKEIERQTAFKFLYETTVIESSNKRITIPKMTATVEEVLMTVTGQTGLRFRQTDNTLAVQLPEQERSANQSPIPETISGTVTDAETNEPLPGVNIQVKGTTIGTSTGPNGDYELDAPSLQDTLLFSFVGYETQEVPINGNTQIDVALVVVPLSQDLLVTALGINRSERSIGYATQQVNGEDLTYSNENNVIGSLAGKIAGVQVTGSSGASLGGTQSIKIRGVNSINGEGQPLIVIDGTPISNANFAGSAGEDYGNIAQDINPDDIQSVNVLKGPAASSLYGIRGQYGVIMITTNKGNEAGGIEVQINSNLSFQQAGNFMRYQNKYGGGSSQTWRTLPNGDKYVQVNVDESWGPKMDGTLVREYFSFYPQDPQYGQLTPFDAHPNNIQNFFETGYTADNGVTISGGEERTNFRLSFNDTKITGVYPNTYLNRNNLGLSANIEASDKWDFSANINYAANEARRPPQGSQFGSRYFRQWFQRNLDMGRLKDYRYPDGTVMHWNMRSPSSSTGEITNKSPLYWANPYFEAYENTSTDSRDRVFGNVGAHFEALPNLVVSANIRGDIYIQNIEGKTDFGGTSTPGYSVGKYENKEMNYELSAQYQKSWANVSLDATLGTNLYDRNYSYISQSTVGGLTSPGYFNINASVDRPNVFNYLEQKKIVSAYGLVSLGFSDTYFLDLSLRSDKSSTLPKDNNSYLYPSVSGSFVFSELLELEALSFGKLRASFAQAGSDLSPYLTTPVYNVGSVYDGQNTLDVPSNINNPDIKPSFSTSYEAGFDIRFFDRVGMNFTYYLQQNKNQIIPLNISGTTGYGSAIINAGLIENKGIEVSLNGTPIQQRDFVWNSTFNLSRNTNQVVKLHPDIDLYNHGSTVYSSTASYLNSYEGKTYGSLVGRAYQRDPETGMILLDDDNLPLWTDATHNFGSVLPDFTGGFQNLFFYKNFSLSTMISFQVGGQFFSRSEMLATRTGLHSQTAAKNDKGNNVRDPVSEGGGVKVHGISASTGQEVTAYVDAHDYFDLIGDEVYEDWVIDASYIKLSEVKLGYTFGEKVMSRIPVKSINVAVFANNPLMIWQKAPQGLDPSELSSGSQDITWYESGQLNTVRSYGLNVKLIF